MPRYLVSRRWRKSRNRIPNSACAGLVAGTPGTLPRRWDLYAPDSGNGISTQVVGAAVEDGISCVDFRVFGTAAGGNVTLRSTTTAAFGLRTNTSFNKPTGATTGDLLVCLLFVEVNGGASPAVTPASGFTERTSPGSFTDGANSQAIWRVFTKPATGSEPASYAFNHTSANTEGVMYCLTGADTASAPIIGTMQQGAGTTATSPSITTTRANSYIINWAAGWDSAASSTAPSGFTNRYVGTEIAVSDAPQAAAGATGAKSTGLPGNGHENFGVLIGVQPVATSVGLTGVFFTPANLVGVPPIIPGVNNDFCTLSVYARLVGGSAPSSVALAVNFADASYNFVGQGVTTFTPTSSPSLRNQRQVVSVLCNQANAAWLEPNLTFGYSGSVDCTLRIGGPQLEIGQVMTAFERRVD